jgi:hypothetical protein
LEVGRVRKETKAESRVGSWRLEEFERRKRFKAGLEIERRKGFKEFMKFINTFPLSRPLFISFDLLALLAPRRARRV